MMCLITKLCDTIYLIVLKSYSMTEQKRSMEHIYKVFDSISGRGVAAGLVNTSVYTLDPHLFHEILAHLSPRIMVELKEYQ